ncbi:2-hydroxyacyl-CoA dehydratase [bacterium]|nr:2-hydroxyacyl-CoA dehydratase [bacterium]
MSKCCSNPDAEIKNTNPCSPQTPSCCSETVEGADKPEALAWFDQMIPNALAYVKKQKAAGKKVVGILCEYTPRELIMAAGGVPVCLCGGSAETIASAEEHLPANLCPLIKSTYGYSLENANPFLELMDLVVAETTCDGKKKMYEMMAEIHPMHVLELPQKPDDADAFEHWVKELEKLKVVMEAQFDTIISDDALRDSITTMNEERRLRRELASLMKDCTPPLSGLELLDLKSVVSGIPDDLSKYREILETITGRQITPEVSARVRVLLTGVPLPHGAERVLRIIEESGGLVVAQENCTGLKPIMEDIDVASPDPLRAMAEKYFHLPCSVMTSNTARMDLIKQLAIDYKADCVIEITWMACITYDVESRLVKKMVEDERNLPYLRIETDYSPSDSARIAMRIEALFETVKSRHSSSCTGQNNGCCN